VLHQLVQVVHLGQGFQAAAAWRFGRGSTFRFGLKKIRLPALGRRCGGHGLIYFIAGNALKHIAKFQLLKEFFYFFLVYRVFGKLLGVKIDRHLGNDTGQMLAQESLLLVVADLFAQLAFDIVGLLVHFFHAAVLLEELRSCFGPHAGNAGDIVHAIAHHAQVVHHLVHLFDVKALFDLRYAPGFGGIAHATRAVHKDMLAHELPKILIGRHHVHVKVFLFGPFGQGTDHVIGLVAIHTYEGNIESIGQPADVGHRYFDGLGGFVALSLVFRKFLVAEGRLVRIIHDGDVSGRVFFQHLQQRIGKAKDGGGIQALGGDAGVFDKSEVRAVNQRVGIEQEEFGAGFGHEDVLIL
jgi:hypothetical protein